MMNTILTASVEFQSSSFVDFTEIKVILDSIRLLNIHKAKDFISSNTGFEYVTINCNLFEVRSDEDWQGDVCNMRVYGHGLRFVIYNKYDGGDYIESEFIDFSKIDEWQKWICTDEDSNQYRKQLSKVSWAFKEDRVVNPESGAIEVYQSEINLDEYTNTEMLKALNSFGYKGHEILDLELVAECIFELET